MILIDFTKTTEATAAAVELISKALPVCDPCERNIVYFDGRQSVHIIGPMLVLARVNGSPRALIKPIDLVHLHIAACCGDTERAESNIIDALVNLFSSRSRAGEQMRARVRATFESLP